MLSGIFKKKTPKGHGSTLEEMQLDDAIGSDVTAATKLSLHYVVIQKRLREEQQKAEMRCFENYSTFEFLTFWLSFYT